MRQSVNTNKIVLLVLVAAFGIFGLFAIRPSIAATFTGSAQAESGAMSGNSSLVNDMNASGGSAVKFGGGSGLKLAIPVYWYPTATYDNMMISAGTKVGLAIANTNNGPGTSVDPNVQKQINNERAAGIKVYGYVDTAYAARSISAAEADINGWFNLYGIDGILFDEVPGVGWTSAEKTYYLNLYNYVRARTGPNVRGTAVALNPGTATDEYSMQVSDVISSYEDTEANYAAATPPAWTKNYPASHFWNIVHTSAGITQMQKDISLAKQRNVGYVDITTDSGANPYDTLPASAFWQAELSAL